MRFFLSLEHLEAVVGLFTGLVAALLCLREQGGPWGGTEMGTAISGVLGTHAAWADETLCGVGAALIIAIVTSKRTGQSP